MLQHKIAHIFNRFADIYEIMGDELEPGDNKNKYRIRAYRQAAVGLENLNKDLAELAAKDELERLPGIGSIFADKIKEFIATGTIKEFEELVQMIPNGLLDMLDLQSVGPKKVKLFYTELGITNMDQLAEAITAGKVEQLPRMGKKSADKILDAIDRYKNQPDRSPLVESLDAIDSIITELKRDPSITKIDYAGSARRQQTTNGDIDIICATTNPEVVAQLFKSLPFIDEIIAEGPTKISVYLDTGLQADLRMVEPHQFGAALQYFTGSQAHNVVLRTIAKAQGYKINEYAITKNDKVVGGETEAEIYNLLGMDWIPPELRENTGEIELARDHKLPNLIEQPDIIADLHMHSTYSDGKCSITEMAAAATKLGYKYIAITDHSPALPIANGVSIPDLKKKKAEIAELNKSSEIQILYGTEVDILADGSLDYPETVMAEFDLVVASVHSGLHKDNTERIIAAIENPHVHIIGHPSTRLINKRDPSPNDWPRIFKAAAANGTILEINSSPYRLDLEGELVAQAKTAGCIFSINTDAHHTDQLHHMHLGIGQARRGGLEKKDVVNTWEWEKLQQFIAKN